VGNAGEFACWWPCLPGGGWRAVSSPAPATVPGSVSASRASVPAGRGAG